MTSSIRIASSPLLLHLKQSCSSCRDPSRLPSSRLSLHRAPTFRQMSAVSRPGSLRSPIARVAMVARHMATGSRSSMSTSSLSDQSLVLAKADANLRVLTLNRPKTLNALNGEMIQSISRDLVQWERSEAAKIIILKANGRAFCAGGDVVSVVKLANSGNEEKQNQAVSFFQAEYELDSFIAKMSTPVVCFLDGITSLFSAVLQRASPKSFRSNSSLPSIHGWFCYSTVGGGLGLSMHTPFRIATENTRVAMPETTIGLFPDVGATFFLPRLDGELGTYLGLTSTNLYGWGAFQAGIASHYVPAASLPALEDHLSSLSADATHDKINDAINEFSADALDALSSSKPYELTGLRRQAIDHCFRQDTLEKIVSQLEAVESGHLFSEDDSLQAWARDTRETILHRSPTSCKLTLMALREGKKLTIDECFLMEMRLAATCCDGASHPDFATGVRHLLVDKKKDRAAWEPSSLAQVDTHVLQKLFFSSQPPATVHVLPLRFMETTMKAYKAYPHSNYSLPSEEVIKEHVIGSVQGSGNFAVTRRELIETIQKKWTDKVGVKEKLEEVLSRRTVEKGEKEGRVLKWQY